MPEIKDRILKVEPVYWKEFKFFQTESFKELKPLQKARLKESILRNQFVESFKVWQSPEGDIYCLDGYHRCLVLKELEKSGYSVPKTFTGVFVDCKNKTEAATLPLIYSSSYATVTEDGFIDYLDQNEIDINSVLEFVDIPEVNIHHIIRQYDADDRNEFDFFEDEDEENNAERETIEKNMFSLAIVLNADENKQWEKFKERIGVKRDTEAFKRIIPLLDKIEKR